MSRRSHSNSGSTAVQGIVASADEALGRITSRAARLEALNKALLPLIPRDLRPYCQLANYRDSTLVFTAASPVWAARLRQTSAEILHSVHTELQIPARKIEVRIASPGGLAPDHQQPRNLSDRARRSLEQAAAGCPDPTLRTAIQRLLDRQKS